MRSGARRRNCSIILLILVALACFNSVYILIPERPPIRAIQQRSLHPHTRLETGSGAGAALTEGETTTAETTSASTTLTVIVDAQKYKPLFGFSIFLSDTLVRFSNRKNLRYNVFSLDMSEEYVESRLQPPQGLRAPCLLVSRNVTRVELWQQKTSTHYDECFLMITHDEFCTRELHASTTTTPQGFSTPLHQHMREYYDQDLMTKPDSNNPSAVTYVPLGPRMDTRKVWPTGGSHLVLPSSQRPRLFHAVFSEDTSPSRRILSRVLEEHFNNNGSTTQQNPIISIARNWTSTPHVDPVDYVQGLHESVFTLAPQGHNPECFRLYEAVEAGSIPIVALDTAYQNHPCRDALQPWASAPVVWLNSWEELPQRLLELGRPTTTLDAQQAALRTWYDTFMRTSVAAFEDRWLQVHPPS